MFPLLLLAALLVPQAGPAHDPAIASYCTGKTTSFGCVPFMRAWGVPSETAALPFLLTAEDGRLAQPGFLLYGTKRAQLPFHGGTLCVKPPMSRSEPTPSFLVPSSHCSVRLVSRLQLDFNQILQSGAEPELTAGQRVYVQWRQHDPGNPWGWDDNLTDALEFTVCP